MVKQLVLAPKHKLFIAFKKKKRGISPMMTGKPLMNFCLCTTDKVQISQCDQLSCEKLL